MKVTYCFEEQSHSSKTFFEEYILNFKQAILKGKIHHARKPLKG